MHAPNLTQHVDRLTHRTLRAYSPWRPVVVLSRIRYVPTGYFSKFISASSRLIFPTYLISVHIEFSSTAQNILITNKTTSYSNKIAMQARNPISTQIQVTSKNRSNKNAKFFSGVSVCHTKGIWSRHSWD